MRHSKEVRSQKLEVRSAILLTSLFSLLTFLTFPLQGQAKPADYKGLEITVTGVERAASVGLRDCPPGSNTVRGLTKPGEEFAIVNLAFKVTPAFKETIVKKPVLLDASGKVFNTAMSFVDPGSVPEYSCGFAYRVPEGTKLGKIQIDTTTIDIASFDKK
jgi:hypothetical protein